VKFNSVKQNICPPPCTPAGQRKQDNKHHNFTPRHLPPIASGHSVASTLVVEPFTCQ